MTLKRFETTTEEVEEVCEGCDKPAVRYDVEAVPLCQKCWEEAPLAE